MNKKLLASAVLSVLSFGAMADTPSFDNIEIGYANFDFDGFDVDGYEIKGSKQISDDFYIAGDYTDISENGNSISLTTVGFGYKNDFSASSSFFAELDYARFDADGGFDENGYEITFGVRSMFTEQLELKAAIEYLDINNDGTTSLVLGSAYNLTDSVALYADYKYESDLSRYGVGVRFNF
jgi:hypothetical protein